ncbi:MAG: hypothetical protein NT080_10720 [Spirochaetes bacterium]|nr:hypothetical protein [Spirochaetota bacterium]
MFPALAAVLTAMPATAETAGLPMHDLLSFDVDLSGTSTSPFPFANCSFALRFESNLGRFLPYHVSPTFVKSWSFFEVRFTRRTFHL